MDNGFAVLGVVDDGEGVVERESPCVDSSCSFYSPTIQTARYDRHPTPLCSSLVNHEERYEVHAYNSWIKLNVVVSQGLHLCCAVVPSRWLNLKGL